MSKNLINNEDRCFICMHYNPPCLYYLENNFFKDLSMWQCLKSIYPNTLDIERLTGGICKECYTSLVRIYKIRHKVFLSTDHNKKCTICMNFDGNNTFKVCTKKTDCMVIFYNKDQERIFTLRFDENVFQASEETKSLQICDKCYGSVITFHAQYTQSIEYWSEAPEEAEDNQPIESECVNNDIIEIVKRPRIAKDVWVNFELEYKVVKQIMGDTVKPFLCKMCNTSFIGSEPLKNHTCSTKKVACIYCFDFFRMNRIHLHYHLHRFICYHCSKEFYDKTDLITHLQTHKNTTFNNKMMAKNNNSTDSRNFVCDLCQKRCTFKANLMRHVKIHPNYYVCSMCLKGFHDNDEFKEHFNSHF